MKTQKTSLRTLPILLLAAMGLLAAPPSAEAQVPSQQTLTPADSVFLGGMPYTAQTSGQYLFTGDLYNRAPVYRHATNTAWSLYRRSTGQWVLDFNAVSEEWSGTVAYTTDGAQTPWAATWQGADQVATRTAGVYVESHSSLTGTYMFTGQTYDGQPVYAMGEKYIYYRAASNRWYLNNIVGQTYVYAYSQTSCGTEGPWACDWTGINDTEVLRTVELSFDNETSSLSGTYVFNGQVHDDEPVFERSGKFVYYVASSGRWFLNNILGATYAYAYSARSCSAPWGCNWAGANHGFVFPGDLTSSASIALRTSFNRYVTAESGGGADVNSDATTIGASETLELLDLSNGRVMLRAANGQLICPVNGGGGNVDATQTEPVESCLLTPLTLSSGKIAFMTETGQYFCAESNGDFVANRNIVGSWEQFTMVAL